MIAALLTMAAALLGLAIAVAVLLLAVMAGAFLWALGRGVEGVRL